MFRHVNTVILSWSGCQPLTLSLPTSVPASGGNWLLVWFWVSVPLGRSSRRSGCQLRSLTVRDFHKAWELTKRKFCCERRCMYCQFVHFRLFRFICNCLWPALGFKNRACVTVWSDLSSKVKYGYWITIWRLVICRMFCGEMVIASASWVEDCRFKSYQSNLVFFLRIIIMRVFGFFISLKFMVVASTAKI